jgi:hypothetical protein
MSAQIALPPLFMLRAPAKVARWLAAALAAIAISLAMLISPQHPDNCHPEEPGSMQQASRMIVTLTPATADVFNHCPGGPQYSVGDFRFR